MIKADVYSYVHSILSTSRSLAIEVRPRPRLCHRMGALQPRYLHITGVRRAGNRPSKYRSPLFLPLSLSLPLFLSLSRLFTPLLPIPVSYRHLKGRNAFVAFFLTKISIPCTRNLESCATQLHVDRYNRNEILAN